jgi:hypothetical protein
LRVHTRSPELNGQHAAARGIASAYATQARGAQPLRWGALGLDRHGVREHLQVRKTHGMKDSSHNRMARRVVLGTEMRRHSPT